MVFRAMFGITVSDILGKTIFSFDGGTFTVGSLLIVVIVLVATFAVSKYVRRIMKQVLDKRGLDRSLSYLLLRVTHYLIILIGVFVALNMVGVRLTALVALAGVAGLALGFGLQTIVSNFVSGLIIMGERNVNVGDMIEVGDRMGEVTRIETRATTIRTMDNVSILVPNENFIAKDVINWSHGDPTVRLRVPVGVAYGSDVERVREILIEIARSDEEVLEDPEPNVWFDSFGDSSLNFTLLVWIDDPRKRKSTISRLNFEIDRRFREEDIEIPFPQRDLWIRGGAEKL